MQRSASGSRSSTTARPSGLRTPKVIDGRYAVQRVVGRGGMGAVFEVIDRASGASVALKRLLFAADGDPERRRNDSLRFRREFHALTSLSHPNIVKVLDYGTDDDGPYYTMELLDGVDLREAGKLPPQRACEVLADVCSAIALLHSRRLLHRDISPRNVRLTSTTAKLIDFGVLASLGTIGERAGTPPFVAPEVLQAEPLDARADLYSIGALAYFLLTGENAFPAKRLDELLEVWRREPRRVSAVVPEVPEALDDLVMSLMSLDPVARPSSAAEVIDRLSAIYPLPRASADVERSYLVSARLVGRGEEMRVLRRTLGKTLAGAGGAIVVEAPTGLGKTRLLRELVVAAQLAGATAVVVEPSAAPGAYGTVRELVRGLMRECEEEAIAAALLDAPLLGRVLPELRERLPPMRLAEPSGDALEDRARVNVALQSYLVAVSRRRALAIVIDDVDRADEASAAVIASLAFVAYDTRLLLVGAARDGDAPRVGALRSASDVLRLKGFSEDEVRAFFEASFGQAPGLARFAREAHARTGGSPLLCATLARTLVDRGLARYLDGFWNLPTELSDVEWSGLAQALDERVAAMQGPVRRLGEALSVMRGEIDLGRVFALAGDEDEAGTLAALETLVREEVLDFVASKYRFRHEGMREALYRAQSPERRQEHHLRAAFALAPRGEPPEDLEAIVGMHLREAKQLERAAELLERAGHRLMDAQSTADAIAPIEAALAIFDEQDASPARRLALRQRLAIAGAMHDRDVVLRHWEATLALAWRAAGLDVAQRFSGIFGRTVALALGIVIAAIRRFFTPRDRKPAPPIEALTVVYTVAVTTSVALAHTFDFERYERLLARLAPLSVLERRVGFASLEMCRAFLDIPRGRPRKAIERLSRAKEILETDRTTPIRDIDRRAATASCLDSIAWALVTDQDPGHAAVLDELGKLDLRSFDFSRDFSRLMYFRLRGEEELATAQLARVEEGRTRIGSMWIWERGLVWFSSFAYAMTRDVVGLKRSIDAMRAYKEPGYADIIALAEGEYLREKGQLAAARERLGALCERPPSHVTGHALNALAETCIALGEVDDAKRHAQSALALAEAPETKMTTIALRAERSLALVELLRGHPELAADRIDRALRTAKALASATVSGPLLEARSQIERARGDEEAAQRALEEARSHYAATKNPVLVARAARLIARSKRDASPEASIADVLTQHSEDPKITVSRVLATASDQKTRAEKLLAMFVDRSDAASGWLYLRGDSEAILLAGHGATQPPSPMLIVAVEDVLAASAEEERTLTRAPDGLEGAIVQPLIATIDGKLTVVGAILLVEGNVPLFPIESTLLACAGQTLFDAGDVQP